MATKTDITNSINTIDDGGLNTALEVRDVLTTLKNNAYGDVVLESYTFSTPATVNTSFFSTDLWYRLNFLKQGRNVSVNGFLYNKKTEIYTGQWLSIDAGEYTPTSEITYISATTDTGNSVKLRIASDGIFLDGAVGANGYVYLNFNYFTQD